MPKDLHLAGSTTAGPTLDDLIRMAKALTGREPTDEEIERARQTLAQREVRAAATSGTPGAPDRSEGLPREWQESEAEEGQYRRDPRRGRPRNSK